MIALFPDFADGHDIVAKRGELPLGNRFLGAKHVSDEQVHRIGEAQRDIIAEPTDDMNKSVAVFKLCWFLDEYLRSQKSVHSDVLPLPLIPEQGGVGTNPEYKRKQVTPVTFGFIRTAPFLRQAEATCPTLGQAA